MEDFVSDSSSPTKFVSYIDGLCSFTDPSLIEGKKFYPPQAKSTREQLKFYSTQFRCIEIDSSNYGIPQAERCLEWVKLTPRGFKFHLKAFGLWTWGTCLYNSIPSSIRSDALFELSSVSKKNERTISLYNLNQTEHSSLWKIFNDAVEPLFQNQKLGFIVFQFGDTFAPSQDNEEHIRWCRRNLNCNYEMAIEFRNRAWVDPKSGNLKNTLNVLRDLNICLISVDELERERYPHSSETSAEVLPIFLYATHSQAVYIRVHRRLGNDKQLTSSEIHDWGERLKNFYQKDWKEFVSGKETSSNSVLYFMWNTNHSNDGVINASRLSETLKSQPNSPFKITNWVKYVKNESIKYGIGAFLKNETSKDNSNEEEIQQLLEKEERAVINEIQHLEEREKELANQTKNPEVIDQISDENTTTLKKTSSSSSSSKKRKNASNLTTPSKRKKLFSDSSPSKQTTLFQFTSKKD